MKALVLAVSAVAMTTALPAYAGVMVVGGSYAESCFKAAEQHNATLESLNTCDRAFTEESLSRSDEMATYVNRGILRMMRSDYPRAQSDFSTAIAMSPDRSEPYLNMAILQFKQGRSAEALPLFSKAIELGTEVPEIAYYGRGLANEDLGNLKAAYADLRRATSLKPKWDAPANDLARYQVRRR
jgi:tetratricopeptide (TPR) repeat protein